MQPKFTFVVFYKTRTVSGPVLKERYMPKKPDRSQKVHAALTKAGRPAHVATHVAKKCSTGKKK